MSKRYRIVVLFVLVILSVSCVAKQVPDTAVQLSDFRHLNLSGDDYSKQKELLLNATFDTRTKWPSADKLPRGFDPAEILEIGKDPGLGIRQLHEQGITGRGVTIAIIDQPLLKDHVEYKDQLVFYEEINIFDSHPEMHGAAVSSIAVGKTVGVAPDARFYYIATYAFDQGNFDPSNEKRDFRFIAKAVRRMVEVNEQLPEDEKIRVLSISVGWGPDEAGYSEMNDAVEEANAAGILVISSNLAMTDGSRFLGMGREALSDPNDFSSYMPGLFWQEMFFNNDGWPAMLLVPMDSRTTASEQGVEHYVFYRDGGLSWSIPYIAGMYALTVQVKPDITPEEFWAAAMQTGKTTQVRYAGQKYDFGVILNPQALIEEIQK
jgi:hypothetical protein